MLAQHDVFAQILGKLLGDNRAKLVVKRDHRSHIDDANAKLFLGSLIECRDDLGKLAEVATLRHNGDHAVDQGVYSLEHVGGQTSTLFRRIRRIGQRFAQIGVAAIQRKHGFQLIANIEHTLLTTFGKGGIKKHTGIGCDLFFNKQTISWH